jgi:hypothetical protein
MRAVSLLFVAVLLTLAASSANACEPPSRFALTVPGPGGSYGVIEYETYEPGRSAAMNYETYFLVGEHYFRIPLPVPVTGGLLLGGFAWCGWLGYAWSAGRREKLHAASR